jgi:hypothetical protein
LDLPLAGFYLLARPSTPPVACEELLAKAKAGERVSVAQVKATIKRHKPSYIPESENPAPPAIRRDLIDQAIVIIEQMDGDTRAAFDSRYKRLEIRF